LLPKFSFSDRLNLVSLLAGMGMPDAFDPNSADLSGIDGARDLYVSFVVQQALVEVDEHGTIAAAATAGGAVAQSAPTPVAIDRPFLFLIRDTKSGSILFMGRVEDPRQSGTSSSSVGSASANDSGLSSEADLESSEAVPASE
jgi:serpin B